MRRIHWTSLLDPGDLAKGRHVNSLLNSDELGRIVADVLLNAQKSDYDRPYVAASLPLYLCVGNLRGVRYALHLRSGEAAFDHQMSMHADHMAFCIGRGAGARPGMLALEPGTAPERWGVLGNAALASGAFPFGLAARSLTRPFADYVERQWWIAGAEQPPLRRTVNGAPAGPADSPTSWASQSGAFQALPPVDNAADFPQGGYAFANVDGGVFNNEPLELCRLALAGDDARNPRHPAEAHRAVLMIDPFPNLFELDRSYDPERACELVAVAKRLFGVFVSQARFKADELALADDPDVASRYAVMPIRYAGDNATRPEPYAIACGALGGFGGFLSEEFRHHDFMLGRRNCQRFLAQHLALPADPAKRIVNPLLAGWTDPATRSAFKSTGSVNGQSDVEHLPLIPLLGKLGSPEYTRMPPWPIDPPDLSAAAIKDALKRRAEAIKDSLVAQYQPSWTLRTAMKAIWSLKRDQWITRFAMTPLAADLKSRGVHLHDGVA